MKFEDYSEEIFEDCLKLFDKNCPSFFAENEREDYSNYLLNLADTYKVLISKEKVVAASGISELKSSNRSRITWIMVCPNEKGKGVGTKLMLYVKQYAHEIESVGIDIAASHLSACFFKKFGAIETSFIKDGWGNDMHRIDMEINFWKPS
jgi:GNAT superfamily N-acetyltransferase